MRSVAMSAPALFDLADSRVYVAGHKGMVGSAILRRLAEEHCHIVTAERGELDLTQQAATEHWLAQHRPDAMFIAAAKVGGIHANAAYPADFIAANLAIALNLMRGALATGVRKVVFLGSSCIYPRLAEQPVSESALLTGALEPTNEWYAVAKIAGIKLGQAYRRQYGADIVSIMPSNLYGPGDNYHPQNSHVPAALIRRFHEAAAAGSPAVTVWGTGKPRREFLAVDDLADACVFVMKHYSDAEILNVGTGEDMTIADFARLVADVVGFRGDIEFDPAKPDGTPRKLLDTSRLAALGWSAGTNLRDGLAAAYADFRQRLHSGHIGT